MADTWRPDFADTPPFAHLRPWSERITGPGWPSLDVLNGLASERRLVNAQRQPIRFEAQLLRCGQRDYEAGILATGSVPTRTENWHDLLNALTWLALPHAKRALNAVQCQALRTTGGPRSPLSDAATLFDESGLVLAGPDAGLGEDLRARRWRKAFVERRADWRHVKILIVGHAVLEKLLTPWPGITAKCAFLDQSAHGDQEKLDRKLARLWLEGGISRPADLFPMPVLGVPGWWPANEDDAFYEDETVFRPVRKT
ncbi:MAG: DUF3025 domain-containing protein [Thiobacillus sp.]|nr:DUF3025 domain-containing protein [Thiobacillus sp.]